MNSTGRSIIGLLGLLTATQSVPANADLLNDKLCIFSAAAKIPQIPGMVITSSSAKPADKNATAELIVLSASRSPTELKRLLDQFDIYDYKIVEKLGSSYAFVDEDITNRAKQLVTEKVAGASEVEIGIKAAAQDAAFTYACAYQADGRSYTLAKGMKR